MISSNTYDAWLKPDGPAALVMRQWLTPVEGGDAVIYPPTYAGDEKDPSRSPYNIDQLSNDKDKEDHNVCVIDSVPSQANRVEPLFATLGEGKLVPSVRIDVREGLSVDLLEVGHRIADALLKGCDLRNDIESAFAAYRAGDAGPIARLAPTSLLFGVWDSRGTGEKISRLLSSVIRAFDVQELTRSAQYFPPISYEDERVMPQEIDGKPSDHGLVEVPAVRAHGGVMVKGDIRRDLMLNLVALRSLQVRGNSDATLKLQRYILGLGLVAFTMPADLNLRQGCLLVLDPDHPEECNLVHYDGKRKATTLAHEEAIAFARVAAKEFGVNPEARSAKFDPKRLEARLKKDKGDKADKKKRKNGETPA